MQRIINTASIPPSKVSSAVPSNVSNRNFELV